MFKSKSIFFAFPLDYSMAGFMQMDLIVSHCDILFMFTLSPSAQSFTSFCNGQVISTNVQIRCPPPYNMEYFTCIDFIHIFRSAWSLNAFHIQYHHDWKTSFAQYRSCFPNYYWNNDDQWLVFIVDHFWSNRDEIHFSHNRMVFTMVPHHFDNRPTITINDKIKNRANG